MSLYSLSNMLVLIRASFVTNKACNYFGSKEGVSMHILNKLILNKPQINSTLNMKLYNY